MKTALINTDFWKDDGIYELSIDERMLYLCLLTNPERDTTPAFKCNDRLLTAYTGFNEKQIDVARKKLVKSGKIKFVKKYYILENQDFVDTKKGKLTSEKYKKDFYSLPNEVQEIVLKNKEFCSRATLESFKSIEKEKEKEVETVKEKEKENSTLIVEIIKSFENIDPKNKTYYKNKTQREASAFLIEEYGFKNTIEMIDKIIVVNNLSINQKPRFFPRIATPFELKEKWGKIKDCFERNEIEKEKKIKNITNVIV